MRPLVALSDRATDDLAALHAWIVEQADLATADRYLDRINARVQSLSAFPNRGSPRDDLSVGVRSLPFGRRIFYYLVEDDAVTILRVAEAARDQARLFNS